MKRIARVVGIALSALLLFTATNASAEEPVEQQILAIFSDLGVSLEKAGDDCKAVATAMTTWTDANATKLTKLSTAMDARMEKLSEPEMKAFEEKFTPVMERLITAAMTCAEDKDVQTAFEHLDKVMTASGGAEEAPAPKK